MLTVLVKAESRLRAQYLNSWLKAMNDPEGTRVKAMMIEETFATIRGSCNSMTDVIISETQATPAPAPKPERDARNAQAKVEAL